MNENKQIQVTNLVLFSLGIFLIFYSLNKLYLDQDFIFQASKAIGKISELQKDIRLKKYNHFEWLNISGDNSLINLNDRVFTNKDSSAVVKFDSGHEIKIAEQTLIRIQDYKSIKIEQGSLNIILNEQAEPFEVLINQKKYKIKANKRSTLQISKSENTVIKVTEGNVEISKQGEKVNIAQDQSLNIDDVSVMSTTILRNPVGKVYRIPDEKKRIQFDYTSSAKEPIILLATDINFQKLIPVKDQEILLGRGGYFWKVADSDIEYFKIIQELKPPEIAHPEKDQEYILFEDKIDIKLQITSNITATYLYELYNERKELIKEGESLNSNINIKDLVAGSYYIKAKMLADYQESLWSAPRAFKITKYLYSEKDAVVIELAKPDQRVRFEWSKDAKASSLFEVSEDPSFKDVKISKRIDKQNFTFVNFGNLGKYYWRARKMNKDGTKSFQKPVQVIIRPTPPPEKPKTLPDLKFKVKLKNKTSWLNKFFNIFIASAHAESEFENIVIKLPPKNDVKLYLVEIYKDKTLKQKVYQATVSSPTFNWSPPTTGTYYWRMQYIDYWDRKSEFSDTAKIQVIAEQLKRKKLAKKKKPKAKPKKKKKKIVKKEKKEKKDPSRLSLLIGPTAVDYEQQNENTFAIKGNVFNNYELSYQTDLDIRWFKKLRIDYDSLVGTVFDEQPFSFRQLKVFLNHRTFKYFWLALDIKQISLYESNLGTPEFEQTKLLANFGVMYEKAILVGKNSDLSLFSSLKPILGLDFNLGLSYRYYYNSTLCLKAKTQGFLMDQTSGENQQKTQYYSILMGAEYQF